MTIAGAALCQIVDDAALGDPLGTVDRPGWLGGDISGQRVLCLAAGGGRQSCLYAAAGGQVTVVDLSPEMLDQDRRAARERGFSVRLIEGSMDDLSMLDDAAFDLVVQPVSTCYLPNLADVYAEVARVLRPGGLYISQHKSPVSLQTSTQPSASGGYTIAHTYYRKTPVPPPTPDRVAARLREPGTVEFLHRLESIIGGLCRAGFVIEDLIEPDHHRDDAPPGSFADRARFVAPYLRIKARRHDRGRPGDGSSAHRAETPPNHLWVPDPTHE